MVTSVCNVDFLFIHIIHYHHLKSLNQLMAKGFMVLMCLVCSVHVYVENTFKFPTTKRKHTVAVVSAARGCTPFNPTTLQKTKTELFIISFSSVEKYMLRVAA